MINCTINGSGMDIPVYREYVTILFDSEILRFIILNEFDSRRTDNLSISGWFEAGEPYIAPCGSGIEEDGSE